MAAVSGIRGRFFATLLEKALELYQRHKGTIDPAISAVAIAAIETLVAELPALVIALNPRGPQ
jgi:hypothetical protein